MALMPFYKALKSKFVTFKSIVMILDQSSPHKKFNSANNLDVLSYFNVLHLLMFYK